MKGLFYAFTKNVRNRPGQQHHQSLFLFKEQELHGKKHGGIQGAHDHCIGNEAYEMFEKSPVNIAVNSPMTFGMIANLELQEIALYSMMKKIDKFLGIGSDMFFSVPLDMTAIEKRAYYHVVNGHWLRQNRVYMVEAPIADALAMGIRMEKNEGSMVVNIGAQSTRFHFDGWKYHYVQEGSDRRQTDE